MVMIMEKKTAIATFLLLTLLISSGIGEAITICQSPSAKFKGMCARDSNCRTICRSEHFHDGDCEGFRRRCMCRKPC